MRPAQASSAAAASLRGSDELGERVLEHGVDQVVLGREVAVERAHADARLAGDLLDGHVEAVAREQRARRREETLAVAPRVAAELSFGRALDAHRSSMPQNGAITPFRGDGVGPFGRRGHLARFTLAR